ncbi:MAG: UDP-N-acetylglucosamine 2-epimerase [Proteocatella sp.]
MKKRKICLITGSRAEYGLLYWLIKELVSDVDIQLQLIVTGMHLSPEFGLTYKLIEKDGFTIDEKVEMLLSSDTPVGITKSIGLGLIGFADTLNRLRPDIIVVLGDRYEILAAVQAALVANIPVAHIHGGELTEGAIDDSIRHAITKMANIHFVATAVYRNRVMQMGECPENVFNFGAPGIDNILKIKLFTLEELEKNIGFSLGEKFFLVTYHPLTKKYMQSKENVEQLFQALDEYAEYKLLITKPNADTNGRVIIDLINEYRGKYPERVFSCTSLGQKRYLSAMRYCTAVIGNSSSGIIEAPVMKKATINIGERQNGRLKASSIIDCGTSADEIKKAIKTVLSENYQKEIENVKSIYGEGDASVKIKSVLKNISLEKISQKHFYDINV